MHRGRHLILARSLFVAASLAITSAAFAEQPAQPGQAVDVTLSTGETIRGTVVSDDGTTLIINHPVLGQLSIPHTQAKTLADTPPAAPPPPPPPPPPLPPKPDPDSFFKGWTGTVELGINGAEGNTENFGIRVGGSARRETSETLTVANIWYAFAQSNSETNQDQGEANIRNDWKIDGGPWRLYALGRLEYDKFQDWDWRLSAFGGVGYEFIKNDKTLLLGRIGAGGQQTFGGSDDKFTPELNLGLDWEQKIDDRQKLFVYTDYYPSLLNFSDFRARIKGGYEVTVDPTNKMALRLGVENNYDSDPGPDSKRNDIVYFLSLIYNW